MRPHDLSSSTYHLPEGERRSVALITGSQPRHWRLAETLEGAFAGMIGGWWASISRSLEETYRQNDTDRGESADRCERRFFTETHSSRTPVPRLLPTLLAKPIDHELATSLRELSPYFLVSLGGSRVPREVIAATRGVAINIHAGWCPDYRGSATILQALYHRRLDRVGATVHLLTERLDAGPILRRAAIAVQPEDSPLESFLACVALGIELAVDAIREALESETLTVFPQPGPPVGRTYLAEELSPAVREAIGRDWSTGWLPRARDAELQW